MSANPPANNNHYDQKEELAALGAIYLEELEIVKSSPPFKFNINLRPYLDYNVIMEDDDEELGQLSLRINFELTQEYPNQIPHFYVVPNLDIVNQDHIAEIEILIERISDRICGHPMIFDICETIRVISFFQNLLENPLPQGNIIVE